MYQSYGYNPTTAYGAGASCCGGFHFTTLVALILIVLTFSHKEFGEKDGHRHDDGLVNKGILFIIAFFFLACGCGRGCGWTGFGR